MSNFTPMMKQYLEIKSNYNDCIIFYRLGDFYEMFFDDAKTVSKILDLALTKRDCGNGEKAPMCGIPHHVVNQYLYKLVSFGFKVAICEQVEDPKLVKGIVKRDVVKLVTPGTIDEFDEISVNKNNYILSLYIDSTNLSITYSDISTSEIFITYISELNKDNLINIIEEELIKLSPSEIILNANILNSIEKPLIKLFKSLSIMFTKVDIDPSFKSIKDNNLSFFKSNEKNEVLLYSLDNFYKYVCKFGIKLNNFKNIKKFSIDNYLRIDANSRINLELKKNNFNNDINGSLLGVINYTKIPMGLRLLNKWIEQPLIDIDRIVKRQNLIEELINNISVKNELESYLNDISDIERINSKISFGNCNAKDLLNLKNSIFNIPMIKEILLKCGNNFSKISKEIPDVSDIYELINTSINDDVGISVKEGNLIKIGYSTELDKLRNSKVIGKQKLVEYEVEQRNNTGIKNLRLVFNKKTGYFFEVTKSYQHLVPDSFELKQTLTNANRYKTDELINIENMIFGSENEIVEMEYNIFVSIRNTININIKRLQLLSDILAFIDVINSLTTVAFKNNYCKPKLNNIGILEIKNGRHPVIENFLDSINQFIPNDTQIGESNNLVQIITGPNMSGKSTYIRQIALIVILAQMGSFVPAESANISIVDKIFTRIGASDNLYKGESTFMVEMKEVNNILKYATKNSLLILDEVGRGTSTYDGLSLAWAIVEYITKYIKSKTFFATHYHELIDLEQKFCEIKNKHIQVYEDSDNDDIIFLRKIENGGANKSYGIAVAKLAGIPIEVINRSKSILNQIEKKELEIEDNIESICEDSVNVEIIKNLENINIDKINPLEALNILNDLINILKKN
ncbi:MAG: DNA mismatch repair protein MutS [Peptoniphilaceae bacterium]|uniref:DNA mismatch repair protein MutS n=1 Tax=Parvimonas sp. TaxID=1944660 RepID=UPI002A762F0D|nr:DNA mismatch repair protein MutS [Parvimonas sp.]MDD7764630.1 DNA mismatch repair protein MutS [Peptoniphilaceae bacterium]MDY3050606.1 DNA mismatch repair protein MutS [Parvimonas sp.]